mmetsp:Transcript_5280/g.11664  ORF Transcript_5280/g.11664 Transcript_5280/m.11664 type:complete len:445 (-) Transcript_5280:91-1425(-)
MKILVILLVSSCSVALGDRGSRLQSPLQKKEERAIFGGNDDRVLPSNRQLAFQQASPRQSCINRRCSSTEMARPGSQLLSTIRPNYYDNAGQDANRQFRNNFGGSRATSQRPSSTPFRERGSAIQQRASPRSLETVRDSPSPFTLQNNNKGYSTRSQDLTRQRNRGRRPFGVRRSKNRNGENRSVFRDDNGRLKNRFRDPFSPVRVEGDSLKTWSFLSPELERVRVTLETDGRPLDAEIDLWQGPDNTPYKVRAYVENAYTCPINFMVDTPGGANTIAVRNIGSMEFPFSANVTTSDIDGQLDDPTTMLTESSFLYTPRLVQGGAVRSFPFDSFVENVQIMLKSEGRPISARIEFLQGPNNVKQILEFYADDGLDRPLFVVVETPGSGNMVRIVNTAPMEYPLTAWVEPLMVGRPRHDEVGGFIEEDGVLVPWHEIARGSPLSL